MFRVAELQKKQIRIQISNLTEKHCQLCAVITQKRKIMSDNDAFKFCVEDCENGIEIRKLGRVLENV